MSDLLSQAEIDEIFAAHYEREVALLDLIATADAESIIDDSRKRIRGER